VAPRILIFGASARAAAFSALRGGYEPICADFFADQDLVAACSAQQIDHRKFIDQFAAVAESSSPSSWIYTGGFEHHGDLVDRISKRHRLWGIDGETLRAIRDPFLVNRALENARIPAPAVARAARGLPRDGSWLLKPLNSGGGKGIKPLIGGGSVKLDSRYLQQRIAGPSFSALYIGTPPIARLIGVTRQLNGAPRSPFGYRGSIGPLPTTDPLTARLTALGSALTSSFQLKGWFGVDYILSRGIPWPVEVNPRYTASVEIHELFLGRSLLADHQRACEGMVEQSDSASVPADRPRPVFGKLIVYASRRLIVPECLRFIREARDLYAANSIADVPWPGTSIDAGQPIMTLLVAAPSVVSCRNRLLRLERKWLGQLGMTRGEPVRRTS
jgi:predicted ATP-grasp superfamily ATP-dependent carboligase